MPSLSFKRQLKEIETAIDAEILRAAKAFHANIVRAWPVDTGTSRIAWQPPMKDKDAYVVRNDVDYSTVLWQGRHTVNGKTYGSNQMPAGGVPIYNAVVSQMMKNIKGL